MRATAALRILLAVLSALVAPYAAASPRISLLTCYPGQEIYELYGHEAIRVQAPGVDSVFNFGVFSFSEPNFVYRFVKGQTDYMLAGEPTDAFLAQYVRRGSRVVEQTLALTPAEADTLYSMLRRESLPQNRRYRYNYVKDNCATRVVDRLEQVIGSPAVYSDTIRFGSYREAMRHYNRNYPWYQLGIDLALGSGIDGPVTPRQEMFVPVEMESRMAIARRADGRPLVESAAVINEGVPDATLPPTPWWRSPLAVALYVLIFTLGVCLYDYRRGRITRWWYALWFLLTGCAGSLVFFLVFCSEHEATSPNSLIWWLNPLGLIVPVFIWFRRMRPLVAWYMAADAVAVACLMLLWGAGRQSANPAFFPMMATSILLAATYATYFFKQRYKKSGQRRPASRPKRRPAPRRKK